jgi:hypothetical protein
MNHNRILERALIPEHCLIPNQTILDHTIIPDLDLTKYNTVPNFDPMPNTNILPNDRMMNLPPCTNHCLVPNRIVSQQIFQFPEPIKKIKKLTFWLGFCGQVNLPLRIFCMILPQQFLFFWKKHLSPLVESPMGSQ